MADSYSTKLIQDLPQQFKGKERIEALLVAIGNQLDQVQAFYDSLNLERALSTAQGEQLDRIGDILVLSRFDAEKMCGKTDTINDDLYRRLLINKTNLNFGNATYYAVMSCINVIRGSNLGFRYTEDPAIPATIILESMDSAGSTDVQNMLDVPIPKAAGVGIRIRANDGAEFGYGIGLTSQVSISKERDTEAIDVDKDLICFVDENGVWLTDETGCILLYEESIETGIIPGVEIVPEESEDDKSSEDQNDDVSAGPENDDLGAEGNAGAEKNADEADREDEYYFVNGFDEGTGGSEV